MASVFGNTDTIEVERAWLYLRARSNMQNLNYGLAENKFIQDVQSTFYFRHTSQRDLKQMFESDIC